MQRYALATNKNFYYNMLNYQNGYYNQIRSKLNMPPSDVFINYRVTDTKRTIAGLLYDHLSRLGFRPFLDSKNMKPGDKLFDKIDSAISGSRVCVAIFSPRYCESYFCLYELALMMETKKRVIPIFCDVKPSQLRVLCDGISSSNELQRFNYALENAKHTVGLSFDSTTGDWSEFLTRATDAVMKNVIEMEADRAYKNFKNLMPTKNYFDN